MNKLVGFAAVITMCLSAQNAFAQINEPAFGDEMDIHFTAKTYNNQDITFSVFESDDNGILIDRCLYQEQGKTDENGDYKADFTLNVPSGNYTAVLSSRLHRENEQKQFYYVNKKHLENTLSAINNAKSASELGEILEKSWDEIGADTELIGKTVNKTDLYTGIFNSRKDEVTKDNLEDYCLLIKQQAICTLVNEGGLTDIKKYAADMGIDSLDVWSDFETSAAEKSVLDGLKGTAPKNAEDFRKKFEECAIVRLICCGDVNRAKTFTEKYKTKAGIESTVSAINRLSDKQRYSVYSSIAVCDAVSYTALSNKMTLYINDAKKTSPSTGSTGSIGGGSGGGGGRGAVSVIRQNTDSAPSADNNKVLPFTDIDGCEWAKEAISELYSRNVISGRDDTTFAPNDNITREEFITMLVKALNLNDVTAECDFKDVAHERWSYGVIASAKKYGIIEGSDGKFNPTDNITRQDIASMVYRSLKVSDVDVKTVREYRSFMDSSDISDYAAEAVEKLYTYGIINGVTDAEFVPRAEATRAQSAKILYEIIKNNAD